MILTPTLRRAFAIAALVFLMDRASKIWIVERLDLANRLRIEVADPWLNLTMAWNHGVNFGLVDFGAAGRYWLVAVALVIVAALTFWARRRRGWAVALGAGGVIGGALGNVWDRLQWGAVADFVNMSCCGIDNPYAFNVADIAIFTGALGLVLFTGKPPEGGTSAPRRRARRARKTP